MMRFVFRTQKFSLGIQRYWCVSSQSLRYLQSCMYASSSESAAPKLRIKKPEIDLPKAWELWHQEQETSEEEVSSYIPIYYDKSKHAGDIVFSDEQLKIFDVIHEQKFDCLVVDAKAGSGKTKTIIESVKYLPKDAKVMLLAYNKNIATLLDYHANLKDNRIHFPNQFTCATFHSIGFRLWCSHLNKPLNNFQINPRKTFIIFKELLHGDDEQFRKYYLEVADLVQRAKLHGLAPKSLNYGAIRGLVQDTVEQWRLLMQLYGVTLKPGQDENKLIEYSRLVLDRSIKLAGGGLNSDKFLSRIGFAVDTKLDNGKFLLDFDDTIYMPVIEQVQVDTPFDFVFVDEAQDLSEIRVELIQRLRQSVHGRGKLAVFGDRHQAIYGFAGCTSNFFGRLHDEGVSRGLGSFASINISVPASADITNQEKVNTLPLSTCYRCPVEIVEMAKYFVDNIHPRQGAPAGEVQMLSYRWTASKLMEEPSLVVAREIKVLVNFAFFLLGKGIPFGFMGRTIGPQPVESLVHSLLLGLSSPIEELLVSQDETAEDNFQAEVASSYDLDDTKSPIRSDPLINPLIFKLPLHRLILSAQSWHENMLSGTVYQDDNLDRGSVEDRFDSLMTIIAYSNSPLNTIGDFVDHLESKYMSSFRSKLQIDGFPALLLSTMHQSRGLERSSIFLLNESDWKERFQGKWMDKPRTWHWWRWRGHSMSSNREWEIGQERNLMYVAWTRAKNGLYFIDWQERQEIGQIRQKPTEHDGEFTGHSILSQLKDAKEQEKSLTLLDHRYMVAKSRNRNTGDVKELRRRPYLDKLYDYLKNLEEDFVAEYDERSYFESSINELSAKSSTRKRAFS